MSKVKVRIAVAVDFLGEWFAYGVSNGDDDEALGEAIGNVRDGGGLAAYFVEAELDRPDPTVVAASATPVSVESIDNAQRQMGSTLAHAMRELEVLREQKP